MNYIAEIRAFNDWLESNPMASSSCILLWYALMYQANKAGWLPEFSVAISTLELRTGLKRGAIYNARNTLRTLGAIDFKERSGRQSAIYSMLSLCSFNGHNPEHKHDTSTTQTDTQARHNPELLYKQNKTKLNKDIGGGEPAPTSKRFSKPSVEEVKVYCSERGNNIDPEYFVDYYEARGWILTNGKKMIDWKATVRTWEKNQGSRKAANDQSMDGTAHPDGGTWIDGRQVLGVPPWK